MPTPNIDLSYTGISFNGDNYGVIREDLVPISPDHSLLLEFLLSTTQSAGLIALIGQPYSTSFIREAMKILHCIEWEVEHFTIYNYIMISFFKFLEQL